MNLVSTMSLRPSDSPRTSLLGRRTSSSVFFPILVSIFAAQGALLFGFNVGFSSPTGNFALENIVALHFEHDQGFFKDMAFAALNLGAVPGSLAAAFVADAIGRRKGLLVSALPFIVGTMLLAFDVSSYVILCIGRFVCGVGVGAVSVLTPLYITEIAPPSLRGSLGTFNQLFITLGILLVNVLGFAIGGSSGIVNTAYEYRFITLLMLGPVVLLLLAVSVGPETPRWLLTQNRREEAFQALMNLRKSTMSEVETELNQITASANGVIGDLPTSVNASSKVQKSNPSCSDLFSSTAWFPFFLGLNLMIIQQWSGVNGIIFNVTDLIGGTGSVIFAAVQFVCTLLASFIMENAGRRVFLISSSSLMGSSLLAFGLIIQFAPDVSKAVHIALAVLYIAAFSFGVGYVACFY